MRRGLPPTIIFHGRGDATVPYRTAELFNAAMNEAGNDCTLVGYDGQPHGFFNFGRNKNEFYNDTLRKTDEFLQRLGYLDKQ